jgi:hypothetical protein
MKRTVTLKIDIADSPAGARDVRLFRNGLLVKVWHGDVLKGKSTITLDAVVPIVAGENHFTAYAFNRDNIKSSDTSLIVDGTELLKRAGTLYVLAFGCNQYRNRSYDLKFAVADVDEISKQVKENQDKLGNYSHTEVISLTNQQATKANFLLTLQLFAGEKFDTRLPFSATLRRQLAKIKIIGPEDGLIIYFAGHGIAIGEHFYLLPHDFAAHNAAQIKATSISDIKLNEALERLDGGKLLMIIDACQSGQVLGAERAGSGPVNSKGLAQLAYDKGMYILTAAQSFQAAKEVSRSQAGRTIGHGLLTFALLEGLTKARKDIEGKIIEREWMNYAVAQVPGLAFEELKKRSPKFKQQNSPANRGEVVFVGGGASGAEPANRNLQRPRVFYRRELEERPLIISRP